MQILVRDAFTCHYCGRQLSAEKLVAEHILPFDQGGSDEAENLVAACVPCNIRKGSRSYRGFVESMDRSSRKVNLTVYVDGDLVDRIRKECGHRAIGPFVEKLVIRYFAEKAKANQALIPR